MEMPPLAFQGEDLVAFASVPTTARFTGRLNLYVDSVRLGAVPNLAITRSRDEGTLNLWHCDQDWNVLGVQAWNAPGVTPITSLEDMKVQAVRYYEGLAGSWHEVLPNPSLERP